MNPEELFRKIFGDAGFNTSGFGGFTDFAESTFGFAPAAEVIVFFILFDFSRHYSIVASLQFAVHSLFSWDMWQILNSRN